jgi:hypothetical protein
MSDTATRYCTSKFGSATARPHIVSAYSSLDGWKKPGGIHRLTVTAAKSLRASGYTMVVVRWHLRTREVLLLSYLDGVAESVSAPAAAPAAAAETATPVAPAASARARKFAKASA